LAAALVLPVAAPTALQAETKPVVVVSFAGYDALVSDLNFIGELGGAPQLAQSLEGILALVTRAQGLVGLDKSKPIGALVSLSDEGRPQVVAFVPVTDSEKLLDALQGLIPTVEDLGDGFSELKPAKGKPVVMKEEKGWAFLSDDKDNLADLPTDPSKLLGDLAKKYDVAVKVNMRNVPAALIDAGLAQLKSAAELGLRNAEAEQKELVAAQLEQVEEVLKEFDHLQFGFAIDSKERNAHLDVGMKVVDGGKLSKQIAAAIKAGTATKLAGLADEEAVINFHFSNPVTEDDQKVILQALGSLREQLAKKIDEEDDAAKRDLFKDWADQLVDVAEATIKGGRLNGGAVMFGEGPFDLVVGGIVVDAKKLEDVFKKAVDMFGNEPGVPPIKLNAEEHAGVTFHTITFPITDEELSDFFGEEVTLALGFGKDRILVGFGEAAYDSAADVLDVSEEDAGEEFPAGQIQVHVTPLLAYFVDKGLIPEGPGQFVVDTLEDAESDDISLTSDLVPNGSEGRLEIAEGVLEALSKLMVRQMNGGR
jgi:hypothetical protein